MPPGANWNTRTDLKQKYSITFKTSWFSKKVRFFSGKKSWILLQIHVDLRSDNDHCQILGQHENPRFFFQKKTNFFENHDVLNVVEYSCFKSVPVFQLAPGGMFRAKTRLLTPFGSRDTSHYSSRSMGKEIWLEIL